MSRPDDPADWIIARIDCHRALRYPTGRDALCALRRAYGWTWAETGASVGISGDRARQITLRGYTHMRDYLEGWPVEFQPEPLTPQRRSDEQRARARRRREIKRLEQELAELKWRRTWCEINDQARREKYEMAARHGHLP